MRRLLASLLVALLACGTASAQYVISTDRPGLGFSAGVVPPGLLQIEAGTPAVLYDEEVDLTEISTPLLIRYGFDEFIELRLGTSGYRSRSIGEERTTGFGTVEVGAKVTIPVEPSTVLQLALLPTVTLPIGDEAFVPDRTEGALYAVGEWFGTPYFGMTTVSGIQLLADPEGGSEVEGAFVVVAHQSLRQLNAYAELGYYPRSGGANAAYAGGGATLTLTPRLQVDAFTNYALTDNVPPWQFGGGVSFAL